MAATTDRWKLEYYIEMEMGPLGYQLYDFYFSYHPCSYFGVTFGQFPLGQLDAMRDPVGFLHTDAGWSHGGNR